MAGFFTKLFGLQNKTELKALLANGALLLDVRTAEEYRRGCVPQSINIPLDALGSHLSKLKKDRPIITVCASGMRSSSAAAYLKSQGFTVYNGGSWSNFK